MGDLPKAERETSERITVARENESKVEQEARLVDKGAMHARRSAGGTSSINEISD